MSALIEYNESKINFRQLCKTKKMEFENNLRKKLLATRNSPNEFWKIVKKATKIHPIKPNIMVRTGPGNPGKSLNLKSNKK